MNMIHFVQDDKHYFIELNDGEKDIGYKEDFPDYVVTDSGRPYSLKHGKFLSRDRLARGWDKKHKRAIGQGYIRYTLWDKDGVPHQLLEQQVCWMYHGDEPLDTENKEIHHVNRNHFDNRICNLRQVTKEEHQKIHAKDHKGRPRKNRGGESATVSKE